MRAELAVASQPGFAGSHASEARRKRCSRLPPVRPQPPAPAISSQASTPRRDELDKLCESFERPRHVSLTRDPESGLKEKLARSELRLAQTLADVEVGKPARLCRPPRKPCAKSVGSSSASNVSGRIRQSARLQDLVSCQV